MPITTYHIHIYFDDTPSRTLALGIRKAVAAELNMVEVGRIHEAPVAIHGSPMFQLKFNAAHLGRVLSFVMERRKELSVLLHPCTGDDYADHAVYGMWLGTPVPFQAEVLARWRENSQ